MVDMGRAFGRPATTAARIDRSSNAFRGGNRQWHMDMSSEAQKVSVIRRYLSESFPSWQIEDGSRTGVDRTLQLFEGATLKSTVQIGMDLLQDNGLSLHELEQTLSNKDVCSWARSAPVVYLNSNTLEIKQKEK